MAQKVREVMTSEPVALRSDASVEEAAQKMRERGIGDVLVISDTTICGMVTDRDIAIRVVAEGRDPSTAKLDEFCSHDLVFVGPDDDADRAVELMRIRAVRRIPVVEDGQAIGIVTIGDMAMERDERSALADISAAPPNT